MPCKHQKGAWLVHVHAERSSSAHSSPTYHVNAGKMSKFETFTLTNGSGLRLSCIPFGATITQLQLPTG